MSVKYYTNGVALHRAGDAEKAILQFTKAIELDSTMVKAYDGRAGSYEQVGQIKLAILDSKQVTILLPNSYRGFYRAAKLLIRLERFEQAKKMLVTGMTKSDVGNQLLLTMQTILTDLDEKIRLSKLCPIATLPLEIFVQIISLLSPLTPVLTWSATSKPKPQMNPIITLSHVCRSWRKAIHSSANLWESLVVNGSSSNAVTSAKIKLWGKNSVGRGRLGRGLRRIEIRNANQFNLMAFMETLQILNQEDCCNSLVDFGIWTDPGRPGFDYVVDGALISRAVDGLLLGAKGNIKLQSFLFITYKNIPLHQRIDDLVRHSPDLAVLIFGLPSLPPTSYSSFRGNGRPSANPSSPGATKLTHLELACDAGDLVTLQSLPSLQTLKLTGSHFSRFENQNYNPHLSELYLKNHQLHDRTLFQAALHRLTSLKSITFLDSPGVGRIYLDDGLAGLWNLSNLNSLDLTGTNLALEDFRVFDSKFMPALISLNLSKTTLPLPIDSFHTGFTASSTLCNLNLSFTAYTSSKLIESFAIKLPSLERLNLASAIYSARTGGITGHSLIKLVRARKDEMKELDLSNLNSVGREELVWLKSHVTGSVKWCSED